MVQLVVTEQSSGDLHYLDISDVSIKGNYSAKEIQDIAQQKSDFTQSFMLPQSKDNNDFFSHFYNVNSSDGTFDSSVKTRASIYVESNLVFEGYLQLLKVNNKTQVYEAVVFGEIANIASSLNESKLNELDFSDFNHVLDRTNIIDSWSGAITYTSGSTGDEILYPIIDYGYNYDVDNLTGPSANGGIMPSRLKPTMNVKVLFERILSNIGYTVNSNFFDEDFFKKQYMTLNQEFATIQSTYQDGFRVGLTGDQVLSSSGTLELSDETSTGFYDLGGNFDTSAYEYTAPLTGWHSFKLKLRYGISSTGTIVSTVKLRKLNDPSWQFEFLGAWNGTNNSIINISTGIQELEVVSDNLPINAGDRIYVEIVWITAIGATITLYDTGTEFSLFTGPVSEELSTVDMSAGNSVMPREKQVDFISSILSRYNLVVALDKEVPFQLNIEPAQDYYDLGTSKDWSDKLDNNKDVIIKPTNEFRAAKVNFTDLEGEGSLNAYWQSEFKNVYNSFESDLEGDFGEGLLEIKSIFESFNCKRISGHDMMVSKAFKFENGEATYIQGAPQLFIYSGLKDCSEWQFWSQSAGNATTLTQYPFCHHYFMNANEVLTGDFDIRFKTKYAFDQAYFVASWPTTDVWSRCWNDYINGIYHKDARVLIANFYLQPEDIANFQYNDQIFIKDNFYRINKIYNYALGKNVSTKVELIKILEANILKTGNSLGCNLQWNISYLNGTTGWIDEDGVAANPTQECCEANNLYYNNNNCYWNYETYTGPSDPPITWAPDKEIETTGGIIHFNHDALEIHTNKERDPSIYLGGQIRLLGKSASDGEYLRWSGSSDQTTWGTAVSQIVAGTNITISPSGGTGVVTINASGGTGGVTQIIAGTNITISPAGGTGAVTINSSGGGGGTPGGSNTQVQYNNSGSFDADANFTYDSSIGEVEAEYFNGIHRTRNIGHRTERGSSAGKLKWNIYPTDFDITDSSSFVVYTKNDTGSVVASYSSRAPNLYATFALPVSYEILNFIVYTNNTCSVELLKGGYSNNTTSSLGSGSTGSTVTLSSPYTVSSREYYTLKVTRTSVSDEIYGAILELEEI